MACCPLVWHRLASTLDRLPMRIHYARNGINISQCGLSDVPLNADMSLVTCLRCNPEATKQCTKCGLVKPVRFYYRSYRGLRPECKACHVTKPRPGKTHLLAVDRSACGRTNVKTVSVRDKVTCLKCLQVRPARAELAYDYPGAGILLCRLCGRPYVDHPYGPPCPFVSAA